MAKQPVVPGQNIPLFSQPTSPHVPLFDTLVPGLGPVGLNPLSSQAVFAVKAMRVALHFQSLQPSEDGKSMSNPKPRGWGPNTPKTTPTDEGLAWQVAQVRPVPGLPAFAQVLGPFCVGNL